MFTGVPKWFTVLPVQREGSQPRIAHVVSRGNPQYWGETHEPLNVELQRVVRQAWVDRPPITDLQLQFIPHYAGKHCLESIRLSRLANGGGAHAVAVGLLRDAVEALSLVALGICHDGAKLRILSEWNEEKRSAGEVRKYLEEVVWPTLGISGLWGEQWSAFWASIARAVQPYAHVSPLRLRWHQHVEIIDGRWHVWINHPAGDFEMYRAARIGALQLLLFWAFAEIVCAFAADTEAHLSRLRTLADVARHWLSKNEVFFHGENWEGQLMPFVYPTDARYWGQE